MAMDSLLEGAALTVLVVFLFLRNWRATVVAGVALVLSILPAFAVMHWLGYTLNSISLLAITLVIGILVDDAIVEIESIEQHLRIGKRPFQAALDASDAIGFAMVAITATIVAVFLPVSFVGGTVGQYFTRFGTTVSAAVLVSLLVACLATPLLAAYLLRPMQPEKAKKHGRGRLKTLYLHALEKALHFRKTTCLIGAVLLAGSLALVPLLPTGFLPKGDTGMSQINIQLPPSGTLQQTDDALRRIAQTLRRYDEVALVFATAGSDSEIAKGEILVRLKPHKQRMVSQKAFEDKARDALENVATLHFGEGAASLERFDRERRIAVEADLATGATIGDALIQSGAERAHPIIMTTIAMVAGMLPAVFAGGSGTAFRAPMAVAVICGLTASTLLSLIFVPVVYSLMDDLRNRIAPKLAKLTSVTAQDRAAGERGG